MISAKKENIESRFVDIQVRAITDRLCQHQVRLASDVNVARTAQVRLEVKIGF